MKSPKIPSAGERPKPVREDDPAVKNSLMEWWRGRAKAKGYQSTVVRQNMMTPQQVQKLQTMGS